MFKSFYLFLILFTLNSCQVTHKNYSDQIFDPMSPNEGLLLTVVDKGDSVPSINLGKEYSKYNKTKAGNNPEASNVAEKVLLYLPNRIIDFLDIFRLDLGLGPATGVVLRLTKYGQAGYRVFTPASLRVGLRGREVPFFIENSNEFGAGPAFIQSSKRKVGESELGAGLDLFIIGAYLGLDLSEIADFATGIFTLDIKKDDF